MRIIQEELQRLPCIHDGVNTVIYRWDTNEAPGPAIIKMAQNPFSSPRQTGRLANEYELTRGPRVPGIRAAYDFISVDDRPALVLAYVQGETLSSLPKSTVLSLREKVAVAIALTRSVVVLHQRNIIHNRLSGANILYESTEQTATLIDFVDAVPFGVKGQWPGVEDMPLPLLGYISPEQTGRLNRPVDLRSDLYALGVVLYELLVGRLPYEATTAAELVHCHIARTAAAVCERNGRVPIPLSDIISRLMAKNPSERYQSAYGLLLDLENCERQLAKNGRIMSFVLGRSDAAGTLRIPQKLYDRDMELRQLREKYEAAGRGQGSCLLLRGHGGTGKTALVNELRKYVARQGGYVACGEQNEYQRNKPYSAIIQAVNNRLDHILTQKSARLSLWKEKIEKILADHGPLLLEIFPHLELIVGNQPHTSGKIPPGADGQFHDVFMRLLFTLADKEDPLVLCIDNLQWADNGTVELLKKIWAHIGSQFFLILGMYRDGEMRPDKVLRQLLDVPESTLPHITTLCLQNMSAFELQHFVCDTLGATSEHVAPLSDLVYEKTAGNPLLTIQLLHQLFEENILVYKTDEQQWQWDIEKIRVHDAVETVVERIAQKLNDLPEQSITTLSWAACLGERFDVVELAALTGMSAREVLRDLQRGADEGLVHPLDEYYHLLEADDVDYAEPLKSHFRFSHGQVHKELLARLPRKTRRKIHLEVGHYYLQGLGESDIEEKIFDIVDQLNEGFHYLKTDQERLQLARLNLIAGRKAKRFAASQEAIWYLSMGVGMLPADKWESHKTLAFDLYLESVEAEYLCGNSERAEVLSVEALRHVDDPHGRMQFHELKLLFYPVQDTDSAMVAAALETLVSDFQSPAEKQELLAHVKRLSQELSLRNRGRNLSLDGETIIKVSRMLSQEIKLEQLLSKLMYVVMENAGAEKGVLIERRDGTLLIQATGGSGDKRAQTLRGISMEQSGEVPVSVVNYVTRTGKYVVLSDASIDAHYAHDPYIAGHHTKSLLCLPITSQGQLLALLYLENNLTKGAFTPDRLELLKAIASQAAISLENARLYGDLEQHVKELQQAEERLQQQTVALEKEVAERKSAQITLQEQAALLRAEVDERKKAEISLKESERRFRSMFEGSPIGMYRTTLEGKILQTNSSIATMLGYESAQEMIDCVNPRGVGEAVWLTPESREEFLQKVHAAAGHYVQQQITLRNKDGGTVDTIFYMMLTTDPDSQQPCLVGFVEDMTERIRLEGELRQSQKMESVGRLAGGVAHDFNNMLTVILGAVELALYEVPHESNLRRYLNSIQMAAERSKGVTRQLLSFSRKAVIAPIAVDLNTLIVESEANFGRLIGEDIVFSFRPGRDLWTVKLDPSQLDQIIINLAVNARDAMPEGGNLTIMTENVHIDEEASRHHAELVVGDYVQLTVSDSGVGMDRTTLDNIFEPFFTTKEVGQGTGLGLATVYGIVSQNNGVIIVYSEPGQGTVFRIYFPRLEEEVEVVELSEAEEQRGSETILLVEDEEMLLSIATSMLEKCGYTMIQAASSQEAIEICREQERHIDLILTDVIMPEMNGKEMVEQILAFRPAVKVLFMSGYTDDILAKRGIVEDGMVFIQKPLEMRKLNQKIREVLS